MRHKIVLGFAAALIAASLNAKEPVKPVQTTVSFPDPAGDATSNDESKPVDIVKVELTSDGENLIFAATVTETITPKTLYETIIANFAIDTDNDRKTGDMAFNGMYGDIPGIEFVSELLSEFTEGKPSESASASLFSQKEKANVVYASYAESTKMRNRTYTGKIKYTDLGVKSGQIIRVVALEASDYGEKAGVFPDAELKLK
jgi:hypothetical protein